MLDYKNILADKISTFMKDLFDADDAQDVVDAIENCTSELKDVRQEIIEQEDPDILPECEELTEYEKLKKELGE